MIWIFGVAALTIVYFALRFRRFQSWVEPVLTIVVAIGLMSAAIIWFIDENKQEVGTPMVERPAENPPAAIAPEDLELSGLDFVQGRPVTSYRVTGTVANSAGTTLQSFRLTIVLSDCPDGACREVARDNALIIARVPPGQSEAFTTFATFSGIDLVPPSAPQWSWTISDVRAYAR